MKTVIANVINDISKVPNVEEIMPKEFARAMEMKDEGILKHLFVKEDHTGAVLVFAEISVEDAKSAMATLPMFQYFQEVIYTETDQSF